MYRLHLNICMVEIRLQWEGRVGHGITHLLKAAPFQQSLGRWCCLPQGLEGDLSPLAAVKLALGWSCWKCILSNANLACYV